MPNESLTDHFPPESWIGDFRAVMGTPNHETAPTLLRERLYQRSPDSPFAEEYEERFAAAYRYLQRHMPAFDQPGVSVVSETGSALLTDYLFYALYLKFMSLPLPMIDSDLPPAAVIASAQKAARDNPRT